MSYKTSKWQFHQRFLRNFCANIFVPKKLKSQNVSREKLRISLSYEKFAPKMLMKLTASY
jgi:hypothetical protein